MNVQKFVCNPFEENTYIVYDDTLEAIIIDPGFYNENELKLLKKFLRKTHLKIKRIVNTHLHLDHCIGNGFIKREFGLDAEVGKEDLFLIPILQQQAEMFCLDIYEPIPEPSLFLKEGDVLNVGNMQFKVLSVPGHSPGSLAFYEEKENVLFSGDVLFYGSRGRTDLMKGNETVLLSSIKEKLLTLPEQTTVYPGHGSSTTIAAEKIYY